MRAFTIIELLVAVAIIILLLSILIVAINAATRTGQKSRNASLMASLNTGLVHFKEAVGYLPPVLSNDRRLIDWRGRDFIANNADDISPAAANYAQNVQGYHSYTSLAEYIIGWASHREDGYGKVSADAVPPPNNLFDWDAESPAAGIRHPGPPGDGVWGADTGAVGTRMRYGNANWGSETAPFEFDKGKVFGPYLELKDERLLAAINGVDANGEPIIVFAGDPLPAGVSWDTLPKVIVDYWGNPLRYYRRPYPSGALDRAYVARDYNGNGNLYDDRIPSLADIFLLRPFTVKDRAASDGLPDGFNDTTITAELSAAEFAVFSAGADKGFDSTVRNDDGRDSDGDGIKGENADNIVQVGP